MILTLLIFYLNFTNINFISQTSPAPTVDIEIETGPKFDDTDTNKMDQCYQGTIVNFFPFDFLGPSDFGGGSGSCPKISFDWGDLGVYDFEYCQVRDIYFQVRPLIVASFFFWAILVL